MKQQIDWNYLQRNMPLSAAHIAILQKLPPDEAALVLAKRLQTEEQWSVLIKVFHKNTMLGDGEGI